jgi:hypothetical protein
MFLVAKQRQEFKKQRIVSTTPVLHHFSTNGFECTEMERDVENEVFHQVPFLGCFLPKTRMPVMFSGN